jgi:hypothetical protein
VDPQPQSQVKLIVRTAVIRRSVGPGTVADVMSLELRVGRWRFRAAIEPAPADGLRGDDPGPGGQSAALELAEPPPVGFAPDMRRGGPDLPGRPSR